MNGARILLLVLPLLISSCGDPASPPSQGTAKPVSFIADIKPLLESQCLACHNTNTLLGQLNLETRALALQPGSAGPFIVPGRPLESKVYTFTEKKAPDPSAMPPTNHRLSEDQKKLLHDWIAQGAPWPEDSSGTLTSFQEPAS